MVPWFPAGNAPSRGRRGAARAGATEQQVAEALGVAILMNGGPSTVYGPRAMEAFLEFAGPAQPSGPASS